MAALYSLGCSTFKDAARHKRPSRRGGEPGGTRMNAPQDNVAVAIVSRADVPGTRHTVERLTPPRPRRQGCSVILEPNPNPNPHASLPSPSASSSSWTRAASPPRTSTPSHQRPTASAAAGSACEPNGPRPHRPTSVGGARAVNIANNAVFSGRASER